MALLAVLFPLLICGFLLVMERLEASLLPARSPVPAGADRAAGSDHTARGDLTARGDGPVRDAGDVALRDRPAAPLPRRPLRDGVPAGTPSAPR